MKKTSTLRRNLLLTVSGLITLYILTAAVVDPTLDSGLTLVSMLAAILLFAIALLYD